MIDTLHDKLTLSEMLLGDNGQYEFGAYTSDVFTTDRPWAVTMICRR